MESVPNSLTVGDTWEWTRDLADYPAGTWTLTYYLTKAGKTFSFAATASSTTHSISVPAATTAAYASGRYQWRARVVSGSDAFTVEEGWVDVLPDPTKSTADPRSHARKVLDAIEATLEGRASSDQLAITIAGRSIARTPINDLLALRDKYRSEVRGEESPGTGRDIKLRFSRG